MTPTFCWVFLLTMVGRAASIPQPLVVDACALLCNPGAETESEQARDPILYPRYPKVDCKLQSDSEEHQAWVIASQCFKLCNRELTTSLEVNCFALRSSLGAHLGCFCEALTPLSPNTMRLYESWRINYLVKELANDILNVITDSPLDKVILCELHQEFFKDIQLKKTPNGKLESCMNVTSEEKTDGTSKRQVRSPKNPGFNPGLHDQETKKPTKDKRYDFGDSFTIMPGQKVASEEHITEIPIEIPIEPATTVPPQPATPMSFEIPLEPPTFKNPPEIHEEHKESNDEESDEDFDVEDEFVNENVLPRVKRENFFRPNGQEYVESLCKECMHYCQFKRNLSDEELRKDDMHFVLCGNCDLVEFRCKRVLMRKLGK